MSDSGQTGKERGTDFALRVARGEYDVAFVQSVLAGHERTAQDLDQNNRWSAAYSRAFLKAYYRPLDDKPTGEDEEDNIL